MNMRDQVLNMLGITDKRNQMVSYYEAIDSFLTDNNFEVAEDRANDAVVLRSKVSLEDGNISGNSFIDLFKTFGIEDEMSQVACAQEILLNMERISNAGNNYVAALTTSSSGQSNVVSLENAEFSSILDGQISMEHFGVDADKVQIDVRATVMLVAMRYSRSIVLNTLASKVIESDTITFTPVKMQVGDLNKMEEDLLTYPDLLKDPSGVSTELPKVSLLKANDGSGAASMLVSDDLLRAGMEVDIKSLSLVADKVGYDKANHTDLLDNNIKIAAVVVSITDGTTTETFRIPADHFGRMVRTGNTADSRERRANTDLTFFINTDTKQSDGSATTLFTTVDAPHALKVTGSFTAMSNLGKCTAKGYGSEFKMAMVNTSGAAVDGTMTTLFETLTAITIVGWELEAYWAMENLRKATTHVRTARTQIAFALPQAKRFVTDISRNQENNDALMQAMQAAINTGQDFRGIESMFKFIDYLSEETTKAELTGTRAAMQHLCGQFPAGNYVRPYVIVRTVDVSKVTSMKSSEILQDVRQYVYNQALLAVEELAAKSFYDKQLAIGATRRFRCITDNITANVCLCSQPIRTGHQSVSSPNNGGPVEIVVDGNGNVRFEINTCTFDIVSGNILILPFAEDPNSPVNSMVHYKGGLAVGQGNVTQDNAAFKRIDVGERAVTLPNCPVGILLQITGLDSVIAELG
jgi:hypothetical protein